MPAFSGLGAPWWDPDARGLICGLTGAADRATIVRAACESMAYQSFDVLHAMERDAGVTAGVFFRSTAGPRATSSSCSSRLTCCGIPVVQTENVETTALGAAYLAGLGGRATGRTSRELEQNRVPGRALRAVQHGRRRGGAQTCPAGTMRVDRARSR
ncbi:MAG: FGGY-family carbohydrate kinase [Collinsella sp.]